MRLKASRYNYYIEKMQGYLVYNTLYNGVARLEYEEYEKIQADEIELLDEKVIEGLLKNGFLIPEAVDEKRAYDVLRKYIQGQNSERSFVISVTTACNARCPYCYEKGIDAKFMDKECADAIVKMIAGQYSEPITITWFGGEPLMNVEIIKYLSGRLREEGILFKSSIISNGLLFTESIISEAVKDWNLQFAQISIDDLSEEYNEVKNYSGNVVNPFDTMISNIKLLLKANMQVSIRINVGRKNADRVQDIIKFLKKRFPFEEKLYIYIAFLAGGSNKDNFTEDEKVNIMQKAIDVLPFYSLISHQAHLEEYPEVTACMRENQNTLLIDADGMVCRCEHNVGRQCGVSIFEEAWDFPVEYEVGELCADCVFYPKCLGGCMAERLEGDTGCFHERYIVQALLKEM